MAHIEGRSRATASAVDKTGECFPIELLAARAGESTPLRTACFYPLKKGAEGG